MGKNLVIFPLEKSKRHRLNFIQPRLFPRLFRKMELILAAIVFLVDIQEKKDVDPAERGPMRVAGGGAVPADFGLCRFFQ